MISFPNCKINIGLQVSGTRADGYHDLQSVFYPVTIRDALEIIDAPPTSDDVFSTSGIPVEGNSENNLCLKALHLFKNKFPRLPALRMHLHKAIPTGAGLGGGSADAAFTLQLINKKYSLGLSVEELKDYAGELGSDCPFFILNKPCFASGRGEILEEVTIDLSNHKILVVNPGIHINTGWAFSLLDNPRTPGKLKYYINLPIGTWRQNIFNDFETPLFLVHPEIGNVKEYLYRAGASYASMSGSGSSLYGIFEKGATPEINFPAHYFCKWV
ncbi:MAG: 4-(cytidine 5'-diphospho)-2-C-methyl-D-erythritol kinase [Ferruginibacter sp.]|nr:4-(cytidine 5'-diphospho)-2-C-methyl-D-erythritol kinase [Ferruginibacter sp.]